ncbi:two-component system sensor histidine kinase NtrB [Candidatus Nitrotoga sp. M5]|uniref:two-component system sensor histidine kinase NtrB n=1 Tax=Candidatus Nitrotoga sp. M5 TaxID=2890409 RepID=UPI001EF60168|nr:ATP-binding protein [Candidatus Nitrotoga sp. M5]CAH1387471.1 Two-component sensor PilS [Candidatus Nitrotoga sp. M5]
MWDNLPLTTWHLLRTGSDSAPAPEAMWRSIYFFNLYRLALGGLFVFLVSTFGEALSLGSRDPSLFLYTSLIYIALTLVSFLTIKLCRPRFNMQLAFLVGTDIVFITVLSYASGGIQSGLGVLLLVSLTATGLIGRGKISLFFAALASIAVLLQHSYAVLTQNATEARYVQAGLLSTVYFAVAWLAHIRARYAIASENLAALRGTDLANMAEANRLVIQDMPDGVLVVNENGMVRQYNPSVERLLGVEFLNTGNTTLANCVPVLADRFAVWRQHQRRGHEVLRLPITNHQVRVRFLPVHREGFRGAIIFLEDMQRVQAQAQQIKLVALGRLTANIAHEVRNPLSSISYATELLQEEKHDPAQTRLFQIIMDNAARLNHIVEDVLQLNQRDRVQSEDYNLSEKLPLYIEELCHTQGASQEIFVIEVASPCVISFDRGHLDQVLWNLCRNSLRYCSKQAGSVQLSAWRSNEGRAILEIFNDGPPVAPEAVHQLFEPFFTLSAGGMGLGLYLARELCEANGATLEYRQPAKDGACFRIVFGEQDER